FNIKNAVAFFVHGLAPLRFLVSVQWRRRTRFLAFRLLRRPLGSAVTAPAAAITTAATVWLSAPVAGAFCRFAIPSATVYTAPAMLGLMFMMTVFFLPIGLFQRFQADLAHQVDKTGFYLFFRLGGGYLHGLQCFRNDVLHIHLADLAHPFDGQRVLFVAVGQNVPHEVFEDILLDEAGRTLGDLQAVRVFREVLQGVQIGVKLVVKTALQPAALTAKFTLVDGKILVSGRGGVYGFEIGEPSGAAKLPAAAPDAADLGGFLAGADLPHFYLEAVFAGVYLDKFTEIHPVVRDIKKSSFSSVSLDLYLAHLHVQLQLSGDSAGTYQRLLFPGLVLLHDLQVFIAGFSQYLFEIVISLFDALLFEL